MDRASAAAAFRDGGSRMADLETRCNQLESLLEIREEQIRSMERHLSQLPISSSQAAKVRVHPYFYRLLLLLRKIASL